MADKIVSWGGIESKSTDGMGITGSLGILNTNTSSSVLLNITGSTNNSLTFISNPILSGGQQNGLKVNVSTAGYDNNGSHLAYNFQVGGTSYFTIANYGLATFAQSISTKVMLIQSNPSSTTSLTVYSQGGSGNAIETGGSEGTVHLGSNTVNTKVNEILRITGKGTTSSTTALLVQNANASASFTVRDDGLIQIPGGGKLDFNNSSTQCWITTAGGVTGLGSRSLNLPGTGGPAHWAFYNTSAYGIQLIDTSGDSLTLSPGQSSSNFAIMSLLKSTASNRGGGGFIWRDNTSGNRTFSFGNSANEFGDETGVHTKIQAGAGGTVGGGSYGNGGHIYLEGGAAAYSTNRPGNILISTNITGSKVGIGISIPTASLHISGASSNVLLEIDSPAVNNILYVSGSGTIGIGKATGYALEIANTSSLQETAYTNIPFGYATGSAAVSITPHIYATAGQRSFYSLYINNPAITVSGSFGNYDYRGLYVAGGSTFNGGITAGDSRFFATSNAVSFQGYNPFNGQTGDAAGGITFTSRQVAGGDEAGIGAYYGGGSRLYIYNKYNASDSKVIFSLGGTIRSTYFGTGNLSIGNGETDMSARLGVKGSGTTSSTTALLVQNANATSSLQIYDNGNITIGLGTTTFTSLGGNGNAGPSSSIYFDNYPNAHQVHHQIITRAAGQGNSYNYLRFPAAYDGVYQFIGAGVGVTLALTNSGSTAFMNYNHNGITTNASNAPITIDPSARTLTYGGGLNDVNHLAPYLVILKGNRPLSSGTDAGGDVYILGGLPRSGSSGASGSIYLLGGTINISGSVVITGSLTVSGSNITSAWTAYTPTWTAASSNPAIGNGTIEGYYKVVGKTCFVRGNIAMGSTTTFGSGEWYVSMPFTASHADAILMTATLLDNGSAWYNATLVGARAGFNYKAPIQYQAVGGTANDVNSTQPFTWTNTDRFIWNGSYEIA